MASNYWMKLWIELLDDPKMGRLSDNLWRRFFECCLMAKELNQGGKLPRVEDIAWRLRVDQEALEQELDVLSRNGLIEYMADNPLDGYWFVVNFNKRQAKMLAAERMRRKREHDKKRDYYSSGNVSVTIRNTETEEETEEETDLTPSTADFPFKTKTLRQEAVDESIGRRLMEKVLYPLTNKAEEKFYLVYQLVGEYGEEETLAALKGAYSKWVGTLRQDKSGNYNPHNYGWVDWGVEILSGYGLRTGEKPDPYQSILDKLEGSIQ